MINKLYIMNENFETIRLISNADSVVWVEKARDVGQCAFTITPTDDLLNDIRQNYYIRTDESDMICIIKQITIQTDDTTGQNKLIVVGIDALSLLDRRVTDKQYNFINKSVMYIINTIFNENLGNVSADRKMPIDYINLYFPEMIVSDKQYEIGTSLLTIVKDVCEDRKICMRMILIDSHDYDFRFELYIPSDRSYNQTTNPYVVFSDKYHNLLATNYIMDGSKLKNMAYVGGEEIQGQTRVFVYAGVNRSGFNRYEMFVNASGIKKKLDDGTILTDAQYRTALTTQGLIALNNTKVTESFNGNILGTGLYKYKTDFFIGDVITIENNLGIRKNAPIIGVQRAYDINGDSISLEVENKEAI